MEGPVSGTGAPRIIREARGPPFDARALPPTLPAALFAARRRYGGGRVVLEDHDRRPLSYDGLITAACALAAQVSKFTAPGERVGVMLPTSVGAVVTVFALLLARRTPALLNYGAGFAGVRAACELAGVRTILTARRFLEEGRFFSLAVALEEDRRVVDLEPVRRAISPLARLAAFVSAHAPGRAEPKREEAGDAAVILFTSGTTGAPKGVVLSHANLVANVAQCRAHAEFDPNWVFFTSLPIFHAFGLTGGILLPILNGLKAVLYPSPLQRERIPAMIQATQANVLVSTDTFASHYVRAARPGALANLAYLVLGAEKVREETREAYARACNAVVLEGYGATECSPAITMNAPHANRPGTAGTLLAGVETRLVSVPGVREGGQLFVRGPNVMKGYLRPGDPAAIDPPPDGWFDTGDLATLADDGYLTITGRLKRFVRIGAEMISLVAVERHAQSVWQDARCAAVATPGEDRPEQIVLVTDQADATLAPLLERAKAKGVRLLELPQRIVIVERVPVLPTGKIDYPAAQRLAEERLAARAQAKT